MSSLRGRQLGPAGDVLLCGWSLAVTGRDESFLPPPPDRSVSGAGVFIIAPGVSEKTRTCRCVTPFSLRPVPEERRLGSPRLSPGLTGKGLRTQVAAGPTSDQALGCGQWKRRSNQSLRKGGAGGAGVGVRAGPVSGTAGRESEPHHPGSMPCPSPALPGTRLAASQRGRPSPQGTPSDQRR